MSKQPTFTGLQAATAQTALRSALGLEPELFPVQAFIGMISDEIEQLRSDGRTNDEIANLISDATGTSVSADVIGEFYAPPEARGHRG